MGSPAKVLATLKVNGEEHEVAFAPHKSLLEVLREDLGLTGTKHGCELGECGTCAVQVNGVPVLSCLFLGIEAIGKEVRTVEGLASGPELHPLQDTFADLRLCLRAGPPGVFRAAGPPSVYAPQAHQVSPRGRPLRAAGSPSVAS